MQKNQATVVLFLVLLILKILASFDLTQIKLESFGEELDQGIPSN